MKRTVFLVLLTLLIAPIPVIAQTAGGFGLRPKDPTQAYFQFTAEPGQVIRDTLVAINDSDAEVTLTLGISRASMALTGGLAFDGTAPKDGEAGTWLEMNVVPGEVIIPAHSGLELPFTLSVPSNAHPGDYAFGFVATPSSVPVATPESSGFQVQVISQAAVSVLITIPGGKESIPTVRDIAWVDAAKSDQLAVTIANEGEVGWRGQGMFTLTASDGTVVAERAFPVGYLLPGASIPYPITLETPLPPGDYHAEASLGDESTPYTTTLAVAEPTNVPAQLTVATPSNAQGEFVELTDTNIAAASANTPAGSGDSVWPIVLLAAGVLAIAGLGLYIYFTRRKAK